MLSLIFSFSFLSVFLSFFFFQFFFLLYISSLSWNDEIQTQAPFVTAHPRLLVAITSYILWTTLWQSDIDHHTFAHAMAFSCIVSLSLSSSVSPSFSLCVCLPVFLSFKLSFTHFPSLRMIVLSAFVPTILCWYLYFQQLKWNEWKRKETRYWVKTLLRDR